MSQLTVTASRGLARKIVPIYRKIAIDPVYAARLTTAIHNSNLTALNNLLKEVTSGFNDFGSNGDGFQIGFKAAAPANQIENAINTKVTNRLTTVNLRSISRRMLPLLLKISRNNIFATNLILAAKAKNNARLRSLIAPLLPSNSLVSVQGDQISIILEIKSSAGVVFVTQFFVM